MFQQATHQIGRKVKYSEFSRDEKSREIRKAIDLLSRAQVLTKVPHSACSGVPLAATADDNVYKLLFLDVGLFVYLTGVTWSTIRSYDDAQLVNEGSLAEQFIGQHLLYLSETFRKPALYYWLKEEKSGNAEIDFALSHDSMIIPVEVKAGSKGTLRSLHQFQYEKRAPVALRFKRILDLHRRVGPEKLELP